MTNTDSIQFIAQSSKASMPSYAFETVDVFTDRRFGGNQLAVFTDARGLSDAEMQSLAAEMNYSETTFVLPPADPANSARVRIFNRTAEMPFAGHPNVGTGCVLANHGLDREGVLRFEELAGLVEVRVTRDAGKLIGATIAAPQPLSLGAQLPTKPIAACLGLRESDLVTDRHLPLEASVGVRFVIVEVQLDALARAAPDLAAFQSLARSHPGFDRRLSIFLYSWNGKNARARMFAPLSGTWEDPATGSASATMAALTLSLGDQERVAFDIEQGVEMGRPSRLEVAAWRKNSEIRATVSGSCVPVLKGEATV